MVSQDSEVTPVAFVGVPGDDDITPRVLDRPHRVRDDQMTPQVITLCAEVTPQVITLGAEVTPQVITLETARSLAGPARPPAPRYGRDRAAGPADELGFDRPLFAPEDPPDDGLPDTDPYPAPLPAFAGSDVVPLELDEDDVDTSIFDPDALTGPPETGRPAPGRPAGAVGFSFHTPITGPLYKAELYDEAEHLREVEHLDDVENLDPPAGPGIYAARRPTIQSRTPAIVLPVVGSPPLEACLPRSAPRGMRPRWWLWLTLSVVLGLTAGLSIGLAVKYWRATSADATSPAAPDRSAE